MTRATLTFSRHVFLAMSLLPLGTAMVRSAPVILSVPKLQAAAGKEIDVPILVKGAKGMSALEVRLTYDPAVLEVIKDAANPDKAVTPGSILPENAIFKVYTTTIPVYQGEPVAVKPGGMPILFVGGTNKAKKEYHAIQDDGTLVTIRFRVIGKADQKSAIGLESAKAFQSNDMNMIVNTEPGEVAVIAGLPWLWIVIAAGAVLLLLLLLMLRRGKPAAQPSHAPMGGYAAVASSQPAQGATFQYRCSKCGSSLMLPVMMAGKQIQCSTCGTTQMAMP